MIFKKIINFFKKEPISIKEIKNVDIVKHDSDDVRLLNFSSLKKSPIEVEINNIEKQGEDEFNIIYRINVSINMEEFNNDMIIDILYSKVWNENGKVHEECRMLGIDCIYDHNDPIYIEFEKLTYDRRRNICNIIQNGLKYSELLNLLEKQDEQLHTIS